MNSLIGVVVALAIVSPALVPRHAAAQQFNSGSSGALLAFPPATSASAAGTVPSGATSVSVDLASGIVTFTPCVGSGCTPLTAQLGAPGVGFPDGIMHFTTIDVPSGVTVTFVRNPANTSVTMLATGNVNILGTIALSGQAGQNAMPGSAAGGPGAPGGFKGGNGQTFTTTAKAGDGLGPGGGKGGFPSGSSGGAGGAFGFNANGSSLNPINTSTYGTAALLPLVGGSGGGGGPSGTSGGGGNGGGGGGGGGGAILIASSQTINHTGSIQAKGGAGGTQGGGGGSGGAIRLVATTLTGNGALDTSPGGGGSTVQFVTNPGGGGSAGRIRLEAFTNTFSTASTNGNTSVTGPGFVFLPNAPTLRVTAIDSQTISATPFGQFGGADVVVTPGNHTITVQATNVPANTTVTVSAKSNTDVANPTSQTTGALTGSPLSATATLNFAAGGLYFIEARANFTIP